VSEHSILDHRVVSERYFFPRVGSPTAPIRWVDVEGDRLACHHTKPASGQPTLLFFHGNGSIVEDWIGLLPRALAEHGIGCFLAEYRGYGGNRSTGRPKLARYCGDLPAIVEATGAAPESIVAYGRSLGSIYAIETVRQFPRIGGLVIESGIADVHERLAMRMKAEELGTDEATFERAVRSRFDHRAVLEAYDGPVTIFHAVGDRTVGIDHAERNAAWSGGELVRFARGDHNTILHANWDAYLETLLSFLGRVRDASRE